MSSNGDGGRSHEDDDHDHAGDAFSACKMVETRRRRKKSTGGGER